MSTLLVVYTTPHAIRMMMSMKGQGEQEEEHEGSD